MTERKMRIRKLTLDDRKAILSLRDHQFTLAYIAELFKVSKGRVSQIANDTYKESEFIEGSDGEE